MKKKVLSILLCLAMAFAIVGTIAPAKAEAASVKLNKKKVTIYVGDTYQLTLKGAKGDITWKTSKKAVATVKDGTVTAKKAGKATISAKYNGKTYKCKVTVKKRTITKCESAFDAVANMKIGWNLGNYFDANGNWVQGNTPEDYMTCWGNPIVDESLFKKLKEMGIGAVRVPVTWVNHFDEKGVIDPAWMARVKEVVDWVLANDMYCIINVHHDTGATEDTMDRWLYASPANFDKNQELFSVLWAQIADEFKYYGEKLVFEGFNEMLDEDSNWGECTMEAAQAINEYNQRFVDTVRKAGGYNATRNLICTTYAAGNFESAVYFYSAPSDTVKDHIIGQIHFYEPYDLTMDESGGTRKKFTKEDGELVDAIIDFAGEAFTTRGNGRTAIPWIIGEFSITNRNNDSARIEWFKRVITDAKRWGATCFIWDNGDPEVMGFIDRVGTEKWYEDIVKACVEVANEPTN
ncbi:MAG: cellulase family glycosylhydrolase [Lachnospiraceae bacterium]|nr:cellulase family glycosylhydrolase [Lachnospiraceae bacterium]